MRVKLELKCKDAFVFNELSIERIFQLPSFNQVGRGILKYFEGYETLDIPAVISSTGYPVKAHTGDVLIVQNDEKVVVVPRDLGFTSSLHFNAAEDFVFNPMATPLYSKWNHINGNKYVITGYSNHMDQPSRPEHPATIHYMNIHNGKPYSRAAWDWARSFTRALDVGN